MQSVWYGNGLDLWKTFTQNYLLDLLLVEDTSTSTTYIRRTHTRRDGLNLNYIWDDVDTSNNQDYWYNDANRLQNAMVPGGP